MNPLCLFRINTYEISHPIESIAEIRSICYDPIQKVFIATLQSTQQDSGCDLSIQFTVTRSSESLSETLPRFLEIILSILTEKYRLEIGSGRPQEIDWDQSLRSYLFERFSHSEMIIRGDEVSAELRDALPCEADPKLDDSHVDLYTKVKALTNIFEIFMQALQLDNDQSVAILDLLAGQILAYAESQEKNSLIGTLSHLTHRMALHPALTQDVYSLLCGVKDIKFSLVLFHLLSITHQEDGEFLVEVLKPFICLPKEQFTALLQFMLLLPPDLWDLFYLDEEKSFVFADSSNFVNFLIPLWLAQDGVQEALNPLFNEIEKVPPEIPSIDCSFLYAELFTVLFSGLDYERDWLGKARDAADWEELAKDLFKTSLNNLSKWINEQPNESKICFKMAFHTLYQNFEYRLKESELLTQFIQDTQSERNLELWVREDVRRLFLLKSDLVFLDNLVEKGKWFQGLKLVRSYIPVEDRDNLFLTIFHLHEHGFPVEKDYLPPENSDFEQLELLLRELSECSPIDRYEYGNFFSHSMRVHLSFWLQRVLLKIPSELWFQLANILEGIEFHELVPPNWLWYCDQEIRKTVPSWIDDAQVYTQLPTGSNEDVSLLVNLHLIKQRLCPEDFEKFLELYVPPPILCFVACLPKTHWEHWCGRDAEESVGATQQLVPALLGRPEYNETAFAHIIGQFDILESPFAKALAEEIVRLTEFSWLDPEHALAYKAATVKFNYSGKLAKRAYTGDHLPSKRPKPDK